MNDETVVVTGSNGSIGRSAIDLFATAGYQVVGFDRESRGSIPGVDQWTGDLLDPDTVGAVLEESGADAVVHLGTLPHPLGRPGHETYRSNAMTTYHVLEAAAEHDVENVAIASSINAMGAVFQDAPAQVEYLPVDERHPDTPRDPYAMGKRTIELQADGFSRRRGAPSTVATLRFPWVASRDEIVEHLVTADRTLDGIAEDACAQRNDLFAYLALEDATRALRRAIEAEYEGHETFYIAAADSNMETPTERLLAECYPDATADDLGGTDALIDTDKAEHMLGWEPQISWRDLNPCETPTSTNHAVTDGGGRT